MILTTSPGDTRAAAHWQAFRITAHMAEPVVTIGDGIHLDGLLAWSAWQRANRRSSAANPIPPITDTDAADFALPLASWEFGGQWGWCASAAQWPEQTLITGDHVRRKPPQEQYLRLTKAASYDVGVGTAKAMNKPIQQRFARSIEWFALGLPGEVAELLQPVTHIGKLAGHGHGAVLRWEVTVQTKDWSIQRAGRLMRRMPGGYGGLRATHNGAIRPPYWHRSRYCQAVGPDAD
jgi:CRISPR type IV-associated protein Csf3